MNRAERINKIESTVCPVCDAQPGYRCTAEGLGEDKPFFHLGRGRVAEATYGEEPPDPKDDWMRLPYVVFGDPAETEDELVQIPRGQLNGMIDNLFLYHATLNMIRDHQNIWMECEVTVGVEKGFVYKLEKGDDLDPNGQLVAIPDPEPDPDEVEYTVAEVIQFQAENREELIAKYPDLLGQV
jgi:hypothetical protein